MHIKTMLAKAKTNAALTPVEARDAMLGCFVTIHGETLKRGAQLLGRSLSDEETERRATGVMKDLLGAQWDKPSRKSLIDVKEALDKKMNFSKAPADLMQMHDQTCSLIVSKVD